MIPEQESRPDSESVLHLTPSVRRNAEIFSRKEGVSLEHFVNVTLAEKLAELQEQEWLSQRQPITEERIKWALALLDRMGSGEVEPGDELPEGYVSPVPRS